VDAAFCGADYTALTIGTISRNEGKVYLYGRLWHKDVQKVIPQICEEVRRFNSKRMQGALHSVEMIQ